MKVAIHASKWGFSRYWIEYCQRHRIDHKVVDAYASGIVYDLADCDAFLWHHHHIDAKDVIFAKQLLFAVQQSGKKVFPDFNTGWHFDDKLGQKYLLEAISAPAAPTEVFYTEEDALRWVRFVDFPKVFKLRGGAGSTHVKLVRSRREAARVVRRAFGRGFPAYDRWGDLRENWWRFRFGNATILSILKSLRRLVVSTRHAHVAGPERGYVLFQEFMPGNTHDIRVIVIGGRAFAIKRLVREADFRASGSGRILYGKHEIDERCIAIAFETTAKLKAQCVAYDFVSDLQGNPRIVEINYGFAAEAYEPCPGYWDRSLRWHEGVFNPAFWMIEDLLAEVGR